ncbi:hypothetical protein BDW68DRAFT_179301 [Aspergillus falconensis]
MSGISPKAEQEVKKAIDDTDGETVGMIVAAANSSIEKRRRNQEERKRREAEEKAAKEKADAARSASG